MLWLRAVYRRERLKRVSLDGAALLRRWGRLHAVRTIVGLAAFAVLLARLAR